MTPTSGNYEWLSGVRRPAETENLKATAIRQSLRANARKRDRKDRIAELRAYILETRNLTNTENRY